MGFLRVRIASLAALSITVACGGTAVIDGSGAGGGGGGSSPTTGSSGGSSSASTGSGGCEAFTNCCDDLTGEEVAWNCEGSEAVCPSGASWPGPEGCMPPSTGECTSNADCALTSYCDFPDDLCGAGLPGTCENSAGLICDDFYDPVCTCEGFVASNACYGAAMGQDVSATGGCVPPLDTFACGPHFCAVQTEYCRLVVSDVGSEPSVFSCEPLPSGCVGDPSCACVELEPCGMVCELLPGGEVMVTCPGG